MSIRVFSSQFPYCVRTISCIWEINSKSALWSGRMRPTRPVYHGYRLYPSKNYNRNNTRRRIKKCFNKTFQKYSQNIMNRLNFEMAASCFDDESETGFHWSAGTSHHFFVQLGLSWLNDCLQGVKIGAVTSWNIPLQNIPDSKVHGINIRARGCPHLLVPIPSWFGPAPPHWQPKAQGPLCELKHRLAWRIILVLKSLCESRKNFFLHYVQINLAVDFQALINERQTRFAHVWWISSPYHIANRFLASKLTSDVDW